jgi:cystathionine beta-lyase family protein involved in aluminum resistance
LKKDIAALITQAELDCREVFTGFEATERLNTDRVLDAFEKNRVSPRHFAPTSGYGYDDAGRDTLEALCADIFKSEQAILRPQLASGTHTLAACLFGLLLPGDELLLATGKPYDTLESIVGVKQEPGTLDELGIKAVQAELRPGGGIDIPRVLHLMNGKTRVVFLQRSRGYALRPSYSPKTLGEAIRAVKQVNPDVYVLVDNCYGAFVTADEPTFYGADAVAGSLIKNLGGGLAPTGGYIAGTERAISRIANRLTAPGIGREVGSYEAGYRLFYQGLFMAPHTVCQALKVAALTARTAELLGLAAFPGYAEPRADIIQTLIPGTPEGVRAYCKGIQSGAPVDSYVTPEPWDMPGYRDQVIMAAGAFVQGASIELSCDAPMRPPYAVYQQGGLTYSSGRRAVLRAMLALEEAGYAALD